MNNKQTTKRGLDSTNYFEKKEKKKFNKFNENPERIYQYENNQFKT